MRGPLAYARGSGTSLPPEPIALGVKRKIMSLKSILKLSGLFGFLIVLCQAVSAQVPPFQELARMFDYDQRAPLDVKEHSVEERDGAKVYDVSYASPQGGRVTAYLVAPATKGRHAGIIFAHPAG